MEEKQKIRIACIGDSITAGYGLEDKGKDSYPARLEELCGGRCEVGNFGVNGATLLRKTMSPYCTYEQFDDAILFRPDIVVVELGDNDILPGRIDRQADVFVDDYMALIQGIRAELPGVRLYVTTLTPVLKVEGFPGGYLEEWTARLQELILEVSNRSGAGLINIYQPLWSAVQEAPERIPDGIHPDKTGAGIIARAVYSAIRGELD